MEGLAAERLCDLSFISLIGFESHQLVLYSIDMECIFMIVYTSTLISNLIIYQS
jgi:hypothetical protein